MPLLDFRRESARLTFIAGLLLFVVGVVVGAIYFELRLREDEIEHQTELAATQVRAGEDYLTQSLNNVHLSLRNSVDADDIKRGAAQVGEALKVALRQAPLLRSLSLLDEQGRIVASSNPRNIGLRPSPAGYLPEVAGPSEVLRIGVPWLGRDFDDGRPTTHAQPAPADALVLLPIARSLVIGELHYTLLAAANTDYFLNYFNQQMQVGDTAIQVLRHDGTLILSTGDTDKPGALVTDFRFGDGGSRTHLYIDARGRHILAAHRPSRHYPLAVAVLRDRDVLLESWRKETTFVASVLAASLSIVVGLAMFFYHRLAQAAQLQEEADQRLLLAARVFEASPEAILVTDVAVDIVSVNPAFVAITGYAPEEVIGRNPRLLSSRRHPPEFHAAMWQSLLADGFWQGEIVNRRKNGDLYPAWLAISRVTDEHGALLNYVGVFSEVTDLKTDEARVRYLSSHDFLTGLPNHREFRRMLDQAIAQHERGGGRIVVLLVGTDALGAINAASGYLAGDAVLSSMGERLRIGVRSSDTVCRDHGGKFLVLLEAIESLDEARAIAARLVQLLEISGVATDDASSVRAGMAVYPDTGVHGDALIHAAKTAYIAAKRRGIKLA